MTKPKVYLLDSNILVYAINSQSKHNKKASLTVEKVAKGEIMGVIAHQNILEAYKVLTHAKATNPMSPQKAREYLYYFEQICKTIAPDLTTLKTAQEYISTFKLSGAKIYDAYLAATMKTNGVVGIITANTVDFVKFGEFDVVYPLAD